MEGMLEGEARYAHYDRDGLSIWLDPVRFSPLGDGVDMLVQALFGLGYGAFEENAETSSVVAYAEPGMVQRGGVERFLQGVEGLVRWEFFTEKGRDWNSEWEKSYQPLVVEAAGRRISVLAPFHEGVPGVDLELCVNPKMAFGTGHHATTHLMLEALLSMELAGTACLDMGCGTGILGIAARRLGAAHVVAFDNDPVAVVNAQENAGLNGVGLELMQGDFESLMPFEGTFDVVVCNITLGVLLRYAHLLRRVLRADGAGCILLSGFHPEDRAEIEGAYWLERLQVVEERVREGWCLLKLRQVK